jgi:hypothetical protein
LDIQLPLQPGVGSLVAALERKSVMASSSSTAWRPFERGYHAVYREHEINHCPGCGRTHWLIGRVSAECAFCSTALPLAEASMRLHGTSAVIQHKNRDLHAA